MSQPTNADWIAHWQRVGPRLAAIEREELRNYDPAANIEALDALLQIAYENRQPQPTSGLVEFQQLLKRYYGERTF